MSTFTTFHLVKKASCQQHWYAAAPQAYTAAAVAARAKRETYKHTRARRRLVHNSSQSFFLTYWFHISRGSQRWLEHVRRPRRCKGSETLSTIATGPFFGTNPSRIHKFLQISRSKWHTVMACNGRCSMYNSQKDPEETLVEHNPHTHHIFFGGVCSSSISTGCP